MGKYIKRFASDRGIKATLGDQSFDSIKEYFFNQNMPQLISTKHEMFIDEHHRETLFRGINIAAKIPLIEKDVKSVSFTNTPFSLDEARVHFSRLKYLGFNLLRWVVPWEAICPNEPGKYDLEYLSYLDEIIGLSKGYGFSVLIDFHQDVWSRFTGGSGAPLWTLEKIGLKVDDFEDALAAVKQGNRSLYPLGHLFWATNADRYAAKTMYTLFFGGKTFAPLVKIDGLSAQDYLQDQYIGALSVCAKTLDHHEHIIGYDIMNEPHLGFIGCKDLNKYHGLFRLGPSPLPLQACALAEGNPQQIDVYEKKMFGLKSTHKIHCNLKKKNIFEDEVCIWRRQGVWGYNENGPVLLRKNYFSTPNANNDFYLPFIKKVCKELSSINSNKINFIEHATNHPIPEVRKLPYKIGFSGHWYDAFVISMRKVWNFISVDMMTQKVKVSLPYFVQNNLSFQINRLLRKVEKCAGKVPFLLSEFGIPFDLNKKKAYASGNFRKQKEGLERSFKAVEKTKVSSIIWNYTSVNSNTKGDLWNSEDFSIFSLDQMKNDSGTDPYAGVRAKEAIVRPYPIKIPGKLKSYSFNSKDGFFICAFEHESKNTAPLEIFLPTVHFGKGFEVQSSLGRTEINYMDQVLMFYPDSSKSTYHKVIINKKRPNKKTKGKGFPFF